MPRMSSTCKSWFLKVARQKKNFFPPKKRFGNCSLELFQGDFLLNTTVQHHLGNIYTCVIFPTIFSKANELQQPIHCDLVNAEMYLQLALRSTIHHSRLIAVAQKGVEKVPSLSILSRVSIDYASCIVMGHSFVILHVFPSPPRPARHLQG